MAAQILGGHAGHSASRSINSSTCHSIAVPNRVCSRARNTQRQLQTFAAAEPTNVVTEELAPPNRDAPTAPILPISGELQQANTDVANQLKGQLILAPLTKGGNLPFRRLCGDYGAKVDRLCVETTRRGLGAELLRKPAKLARLVNGIAAESPLPITVKIRSGYNEKTINAPQVVELLQAAGAAAVTIHGRTREQRYKKAADWQLISQIAETFSMPIIGNGDILTVYEARDRLANHGCHAVMVGRGALIRPWLFQEHDQGAELDLTTRDRIGVYRRLASYMRDHFGNDDWGKRKAFYFFPWHFSFFHRYRSLPERLYLESSRQRALITVRQDLFDTAVGETLDSLPLVERLLRCENEKAHAEVAGVIWDSGSDDDAFVGLQRLAEGSLAGWEEEVRGSDRDREDASAEG